MGAGPPGGGKLQWTRVTVTAARPRPEHVEVKVRGRWGQRSACGYGAGERSTNYRTTEEEGHVIHEVIKQRRRFFHCSHFYLVSLASMLRGDSRLTSPHTPVQVGASRWRVDNSQSGRLRTSLL